MSDDKPGAWKEGLEPKQVRFVEEYLVDLNGTQAAIRAGYSEHTANQLAYQLLRKPKVAEAVALAMAERPGVTRARIVDELASIAFANAGDYFAWGPDGVTVKPSDDLTEAQRGVIAEVSQTVTEKGGAIRVKLSDKQAALEKLARVFGMFSDKVELTGKGGEPLAPETGTRDLARAVLDILRTAQVKKEGDGQ
jgi:phage terminase small subunit